MTRMLVKGKIALIGEVRHWKNGNWKKIGCNAWTKVKDAVQIRKSKLKKFAPYSMALASMMACGRDIEMDAELRPYVNAVLSWCAYDQCVLRPDVDEIKFGEVDADEYGKCDFDVTIDNPTLQTRRIVISKKDWDSFSDSNRLEVIAHELAHCNWSFFGHQKTGLMTAKDLTGEDPESSFKNWYKKEIEPKDPKMKPIASYESEREKVQKSLKRFISKNRERGWA